jgi:hypothetical protein
MPVIKRWFPVSHDINRDPEVRELCKRFGVSGLRIWLEILSIADRNGGCLPGDFSGYVSILAGASESTWRHVEAVLEWLSRWLGVDTKGRVMVLNYGKYNRTAEGYPLPPDLPRPYLNNSYKNKSYNPASPAPSADVKNSGKKAKKKGGEKRVELSPALRQQTDRYYFSDPVKFKKLIVWVNQGRKAGWSDADMADCLQACWDYRHVSGDDDSNLGRPVWWAYFDTVLVQRKAKANARQSESEASQYKTELAETAKLIQLPTGERKEG